MARKIVIDNSNGEVRAAVIEDGKLADLFLDRSRHPSVLGNIYKGKVENVLPGMQAAFVDIGLEKNAFLYVDDASASLPDIVKSAKNGDEVELPKSKGKSIRELLKPGQEVLVQVTKEAIGTKGARVVTDVTLAGRYVVLIPSVNYVGVSRKISDDAIRDRLRDLAHKVKPRGMGLIVRTVAEEQPEEEIARDIEFLTRAWKKIKAKSTRIKAPGMIHYDADLVYRMARDYFGDDVTEFTVNTQGDYSKVSDLLHIEEGEKDPRIRLYSDKKPVFEAYGIEEEIWKATRRKVWLNSGGYLIFDSTEALTVIDVNTGKFTGNKDLADTAFRNNMEAAAELARQIRLRNIGGILIADFIDMESEDHKKRVLEELEKHLAKDKARTSVLGITKLGLIEMTRKKSQQGLVELTHRICDICDGRGKVISEETLALRAERLIKREAASTDMQALLIGLNPYVAGELSQNNFAAVTELEEQTLRDIFIKSDPGLGRDDVKVIAIGSLEEILTLVHPVKKSETIEVMITQPKEDKPEHGLATYKGLAIYVEDAGSFTGKTVKVKISRLFKTYAKARLEVQADVKRQFKRLPDEDDYEGMIIETREPKRPYGEKAAVNEAPATAEQTSEGTEAALETPEIKKKRRRRRHRRSSKEKPGAAAAQVDAAGLDAASPTEALEPEGKALNEAEEMVLKNEAPNLPKQASTEADVAQATAKKKRRRRHRSKKPAAQSIVKDASQPYQAAQEASVPDKPAVEASTAAPVIAAGGMSEKAVLPKEKKDEPAAESEVVKQPKSEEQIKKQATRRARKTSGKKTAGNSSSASMKDTVQETEAAKSSYASQAEANASDAKPKRRSNRRRKAAGQDEAGLAIDTKAGE